MSIKLNEIKDNAGARTKKKLRGRGIGSGLGKTSGRGGKGQTARSGVALNGFEGGQNPLMQRQPKLRGFTPFWDKPITLTTDKANALKGVIDNFTLFEAGFIDTPYVNVRLVVRGEVTEKLQVRLQAASANAVAMIQKAGGSFEKTPKPKREVFYNCPRLAPYSLLLL